MSDTNSDNERGQDAWKELVLRELDRVTQLVKSFRFPDHPDVRVPSADVDDAVQASFMRLLGMDFRGTTEAEFAAALTTCVRYACMDYCRRIQRIDQGIKGSLDEQVIGEDGSARGRFERELSGQAMEKAEQDEINRHQIQRLDEALELLDNEQMREALRMTWDGHGPQEIADALDTSVDNVYQLRSRGQRRLLAHLYGDGDGRDADGKR